jgi:hypothetical protein
MDRNTNRSNRTVNATATPATVPTSTEATNGSATATPATEPAKVMNPNNRVKFKGEPVKGKLYLKLGDKMIHVPDMTVRLVQGEGDNANIGYLSIADNPNAKESDKNPKGIFEINDGVLTFVDVSKELDKATKLAAILAPEGETLRTVAPGYEGSEEVNNLLKQVIAQVPAGYRFAGFDETGKPKFTRIRNRKGKDATATEPATEPVTA